MFICNFWRACSKSSNADSVAALRMNRVCAMLQWSSEFVCDCVLLANKSFASLHWQQSVHDVYVDRIAEQKRLCDVFTLEYKPRDDALKRVYESYDDIQLSTTIKNSMM